MIPREELLRVRRLASRSNPKIKEWSSLGDRARRDELGLTVADGVKLAVEALSGGKGLLTPSVLLFSDTGAQAQNAGELFERAGQLGLDRYSLTDDCFAKVVDRKNNDGVAVLSTFSREPDSVTFSRPDGKWLAAAGVQDPGNAGALARSALAAGFHGCLFVNGADPVSPKFIRGSMGAAFSMPCYSVDEDGLRSLLPGTQIRTYAATVAGNAVDYRTVRYTPPLVLLIGGERGLPEHLLDLAETRVTIPLHGGVESLNLAVAAGIIAFEAARQWDSHDQS